MTIAQLPILRMVQLDTPSTFPSFHRPRQYPGDDFFPSESYRVNETSLPYHSVRTGIRSLVESELQV